MRQLPEMLLSTSGSWVRSGVLSGAPALIIELGGDLAQIFSATDITAEAIQEQDHPLNVKQVVNFLALAAHACNTEDFGLRLSTRQNFSVMGPIWTLIQNAETVRQMLTDMSRYFMLHTRGAIVGLERANDGVTLSYNLTTSVSGDDRQVIELGLGILCSDLRRHAPSGWQPRDVQLRYSQPKDLSLYRKILGPNIRFNQDNNTVTLDAALLDMPLATGSRQHHAMINNWLEQQRNHLPQTILLTVETIIRSLLPYSACTLSQVALALALSERTLQRRLGEINASFGGIRDHVRADLALKYLRQSNLSCSEIAEILGYSDLSALSRSFKRWHGITASQARDKKDLQVSTAK